MYQGIEKNIPLQVAASDQNRVVLTEVDRTLTGEYQCEVSADAPLFHTDIKAAMMVVVGELLILILEEMLFIILNEEEKIIVRNKLF